MKRAPVALAAIVVAGLVTAGTVALVGDGATAPKAPSESRAATTAAETDTSRPLDRDALAREAKAQAEQAAQAQDELADQVRKRADELRPASSRPHRLQVTISEQKPYDAYMPGDRPGECVRASLAPAQLIVTDATATYRNVLAEQAIPATARLAADGTCEAVVTVDVPVAPRYQLGVGIMGRGIKRPTDPGGTEVNAGASPQVVVVRR